MYNARMLYKCLYNKGYGRFYTHTHAHTHKLSYSNIIIKVLKRNIIINMDISYFDF